MARVDGVSVREMRTLLARAYAEDPLMVWIFPDDESREHAVAAWLGIFVEHYLDHGRIDTVGTDQLEAVSVWRMPDQPSPGQPVPSPPTLPTISGLLSDVGDVGRRSALTGLFQPAS